jgi:hypothetical protein
MNALQYDAAGIGNHEFNFGQPYLSQVTGQQFDIEGQSAPDFPRRQQHRTAIQFAWRGQGQGHRERGAHRHGQFAGQAPGGNQAQFALCRWSLDYR